jgi:hypothetical protein
MAVLKNKISLLELRRYVFSRQMYLLLMQVKPAESAEKGLNFIISMRNSIEQKLENSYNSTNVSSFFICMTQKYVKYYLISLCAVSCMTYEININYYACLRIYIFTHLFTVRLHIYVLLTQ